MPARARADDAQDPIKARFDGKAPYIKYARGENSGLVGFYKPLTEDDIAYVKTTITKINSNDVTWSIPTGACHPPRPARAF